LRARTLVAVVGIPAFIAFMVVTAPASFIASRATHESQGHVHFDEAHGTLWSGSVRAHVDAPGGAFTFDRVAWRFVPGKLMEGRLAFDVAVDSREASGNVQVLRGWSEWEARGATARVEARILPVFLPLVAAWRPEGSVLVAADGVRWSDRELHGPVSVEWRDAGVSLSEVKPLGGYRLALQGVGETAKLALSTLTGPLLMSGSGEWKLPASVTFSGEARTEGSSAAALEPLVSLLGPRRPDGARSIEVRIR
jgi:general secretion pathway protein N